MSATIDDGKLLTLRAAYELFKRPGMVGQASPRTFDAYTNVLNAWERFTDDPPVGSISNRTLAEFRQTVLAAGLRPISFNKYWIHVRAILRRIGPPDTGNPLGEGIIDRIPYVEVLRHESELPRIATADELDAVYAAAAKMTWPPSLEVAPADWWRALFAVGLGCGPRIYDLLRLPVDAFDLDAGTLRFRANKTRKVHVLPLGDVVAAHVRRIIGPRPALFATVGGPSLANRHAFYGAWHELLDLAGIGEHFTPHTLRRTCGSLYFRHGGYELASYVLGHSLRDVTMRFYIDPSAALRDAADKLDWPLAFRKILDGDPAEKSTTAAAIKLPLRIDWTFGIGRAAWRGRELPLRPRTLALLRALVAAGRPVPAAELRPIVWHAGQAVHRGTVSTAAHELRRALVEALELPAGWDPVPFTEGGYALNLPDNEERGDAET